MKRTKKDVEYWELRAKKLFENDARYKSTKLRYVTLKLLLEQKYPWINQQSSIIDFLKDTVYLDRKMRLLTEGEEKELKDELSEDWKQEHGYFN